MCRSRRTALCRGLCSGWAGARNHLSPCPRFSLCMMREAVLPLLPRGSSLVWLFYCARKAAPRCQASRMVTAGFIPAAAHQRPAKSSHPLARTSSQPPASLCTWHKGLLQSSFWFGTGVIYFLKQNDATVPSVGGMRGLGWAVWLQSISSPGKLLREDSEAHPQLEEIRPD